MHCFYKMLTNCTLHQLRNLDFVAKTSYSIWHLYKCDKTNFKLVNYNFSMINGVYLVETYLRNKYGSQSSPIFACTVIFFKHSVLGIFIAFSIKNLKGLFNSVYILDYQIGSVCKEINNIYCTATINTMLYKGFWI